MKIARALAGAGLGLALTLTVTPSLSQDLTTTAAVERLFAGEIEPEWLTEAFAAEVPADELEALIADLTQNFGVFEGIEGEGSELTVKLAEADVPTQITLDGEGKILGLFFEGPIPLAGSIEDHIAAIAALPGATSVVIVTDGERVHGKDTDTPLAVGSTFKLGILVALKKAVAAGRLSLDETVALDDAWRSAGSGMLHNWPGGTPLTLATLANLMIAISDNTATDALMAVVGREAVEAELPQNRPLLSTAEMFKLNAPENAERLASWLDGDEAERRAILADLAALPLPPPGAAASAEAVAEWHLSTAEACVLMEAAAGAEALGINPGLASKNDWAEIAYKGGSNTGVLNFTTRVVDEEGRVHCVSATWNDDSALSPQKLASPYRGILKILSGDAPASE